MSGYKLLLLWRSLLLKDLLLPQYKPANIYYHLCSRQRKSSSMTMSPSKAQSVVRTKMVSAPWIFPHCQDWEEKGWCQPSPQGPSEPPEPGGACGRPYFNSGQQNLCNTLLNHHRKIALCCQKRRQCIERTHHQPVWSRGSAPGCPFLPFICSRYTWTHREPDKLPPLPHEN